MTYILTGWYETDNGAVMLDESGHCLADIVAQIQFRDEDFGHTDMELELHLPSGNVKCVEDIVYRLVQESEDDVL
jgi:hypothetical protein